MSATNLLKLPPEVLTEIISRVTDYSLPRWLHAVRWDLANLRLTCKDLNLLATPLFGSISFTRCHFVLSEPGLQGLIALSAHPVLSGYIKEIGLGCHFLPVDVEPKEIFERGVFTRSNFQRQLLGLSFMLEEIHVRREAQTRFLISGGDVELLSKALELLKGKSQPFILSIYDNAGHRLPTTRFIKGHGFDKTYGPILSDFDNWQNNGLTPFLDCVPDPGTTLRAIDKALKRVGSPVCLAMDLCEGFSFPLSSPFGSESIRDGSFHRRLRRMFVSQTGKRRGWKLIPNTIFSLRWWNTHQCCTELRVVAALHRLEFRTSQPGHFRSLATFEGINSDFGSLKPAFSSNMFREICFEKAKVKVEDFIRLLARHEKVLKFLQLFNVEIVVTTGSRLDVITALKNLPKLERMEWKDVTTFDNKCWGEDKRKSFADLVFNGKDVIRTELEKLEPEVGGDIVDSDYEAPSENSDDERRSEGLWEVHSIEDWEDYVWDEEEDDTDAD